MEAGKESGGEQATLRLTRPWPVFHQNSVADNVTDIETPSQGRADEEEKEEGMKCDER